ncbi:glycoside hydrolase superfamily [Protomyces lactucae-debilis]|uniref:alpha-amylase n=1 Tax=Protomyces lactucae-debilis TaxID=2754530 RepID=A0A1Y2FUM6_PROLT|nr:glycoside hydrolase superfamily [Protomyces lactucae-debilis]ORY87713.1 glycoside hydrolase superfamily [Protomyces lactucae-debilis]
MHLATPALALLTAFAGVAEAKTAAEWRSRSIYQLFTDRFAMADGSSPVCNLGERKYCGGNWQGIQNKLSYITDLGFDAIWISPIVACTEALTQYGQSYHGYWTVDINKLNPHFGTANDLKNLVAAAHAQDVLVMIDLTINSMAYPGAHDKVDYSTFQSPFNKASAYHQWCWIDYTNATSILECWLGDDNVALLDVKTEDSGIRSTYQNWIKNIQATYNVDGMRIDALKSIEIPFFPDFQKAAGMFGLGENYQADPTMNCAYQPAVDGLLNFPLYYGALFAFNGTGGGMDNLAMLIKANSGNCTDVSLLGNFLENHDVPRYAASTNDQHQRLNAFAFTFVMDGMPVVYYGQEQSFTGTADPLNREALWPSGYDEKNPYYQAIKALNAVRKNCIATDATFLTTETTILQHDIKRMVLQKGDLLSILSNDGIYGSNETYAIPKTGYAGNTELIEVLSQNRTTTDASGALSIKLKAGAPLIFWPYSKWNSAISRPNLDIVIDTRTTATTTVTTKFFYPTAQSIRSDALQKSSMSLASLIASLVAGAAVLGAFVVA